MSSGVGEWVGWAARVFGFGVCALGMLAGVVWTVVALTGIAPDLTVDFGVFLALVGLIGGWATLKQDAERENNQLFIVLSIVASGIICLVVLAVLAWIDLARSID